MDYIEAFKNLRTNNKYGRKSPHKAILMLTVIELYEQNILTDNEIFYDEKLKSMFLKVWNRVLPKEPLSHPDAYLPFWYLQSDSFWHIVPIRGKEDILSLMRDTNIKPSEAKLNDSVKYAELDEDLYFLMTIASGRSSLKRALLETYTQLSEYLIDKMAESVDNSIDHSLSAMDEYEQILSSKNNDEKEFDNESSFELEKQFKKLSDDLQIALSYEYFAFLKNHRSERNMLRDVCPNVYTLYDSIISHPIQRTLISPSFAFIYANFLCDLKISLMSENGSMELIDKIEDAIAILREDNVEDDSSEAEETIVSTDEIEELEVASVYNKDGNDNNVVVEQMCLESSNCIAERNTTTVLNSSSEEVTACRRGKAWTNEEEDLLTRYFKLGTDTATIAKKFGRTEVAIKIRLAKLGLIEYVYGQKQMSESSIDKKYNEYYLQDDFYIKNTFRAGCIYNKDGERVYYIDGHLKYIRGKLYRLNYKEVCFTIKEMVFNGSFWMRGSKKIVAYPTSALYRLVNVSTDFFEEIDDIIDDPIFENCKIKVKGIWYNNKGELLTGYYGK